MIRLLIRAPMHYVHTVRDRFDQKTLLRDVGARLERSGTGKAVLVMQDPTDNTSFTALVQAAPRGQDDILRILRIELAEDLPPPFSGVRRHLDLDPGLTDDELDAVHVALGTEDNPRHLEGFASTLDPWFPVAASLLLAKRRRIDVYSGRALYDHPRAIDQADLRRRRESFRRYAARQRLPLDLAETEVRRIACFLVTEPPPHEVKDHLRTSRIPREALDLAFAMIRQDSHGIPVVDPAAARYACPPTGQERFVSPSALQLAHALGKPEMSGVQVRRRAPEIAHDIERGQGADEPHAMMRAQLSTEKAKKTLERQRWTEWYRKENESRIQPLPGRRAS